ncbi:MAG: protein RecA [Candidatus Tyloplasma litorale]|nr:MAG: protein RecA [Mycoplasmatales bacterium]
MKEKDFKSLLKNIEKEYGKGSIMSFSNNQIVDDVEVISTGSILLDDATGIGGYPKGRIIEVYGPESSGKTTMALLAIAEAQKQKNSGLAAFIDAEHAIDIKHAERMGVNLEKILISQPDSGEQALQLVDHLVSTGEFSIIVVDSVAALTPIVELEGNMEDQTIGAQARLLSKSMRKLSGIINKTNTIVIFINQIREKVGIIFGNPEVTPGGKALKFASSLRIDIRIKERIKEKEVFIGQRIKIKVVKNKMASPYREVETIFYYKNGINKSEEILELAIKKGIVKQSGSWYYFNDKKLGQGKTATSKLISGTKVENEIYEKIFSK